MWCDLAGLRLRHSQCPNPSLYSESKNLLFNFKFWTVKSRVGEGSESGGVVTELGVGGELGLLARGGDKGAQARLP